MAKEKRVSILKAVRNPLGFFALALLVAEGAIGTIAALKLKDELLFYALVLMAVLFVLPTGLVAAIAFWRPTHLFEQVDELKDTINSEGFRDVIDDAIIELVKDECLREREEAANNGTQPF